MITNNKRSRRTNKILTVILILAIGLIGLTGCKNTDKVASDNSADDISAVGDAENDALPSATQTPEITSNPVDSGDIDGSSFTQSAALLGLSKEELFSKLDEDYEKVDEGGLEFAKQGIRVWFDEKGNINQVYTNSSEIDFNGAKIGDDISNFQGAFGEPLKDSNGNAVFQYDNYYLSVYYDVDTKETFAAYILTEELAAPELEGGTESFYGEWLVKQVLAYGAVGTYSKEDAEGLIGKKVNLSADSATCFGDEATIIDKIMLKPSYSVVEIGSSDFATNYKMTFEKLGITTDTVTEVTVIDAEGNGYTFLVKDDNTLIVIGGGTYFELVRN